LTAPSLSWLIDRFRPLLPKLPVFEIPPEAVDGARRRAAEQGLTLESLRHRARASALAMLARDTGVIPEHPFYMAVASLTLALDPRPLVHELGPGVAEAVDATRSHALPPEPPRLLRRAFVLESTHPEQGGRLFDDTWCLGGYSLDGAIYLCGITPENRAFFGSWRPRWGSGDEVGVGAGEDGLVRAGGEGEDPEAELRAWARRAARFALTLGLMLEAEGTPLRWSDTRDRLTGPRGKRKRVGVRRGAWVMRRVSLDGPPPAGVGRSEGGPAGGASPGRVAAGAAPREGARGRVIQEGPFDFVSLIEGAQLADGRRVTLEVLHPQLYPSAADRDRLVERLRHNVALVREHGQADFVTYDEVITTGEGHIGLVLSEPLVLARLGTIGAPGGAYGRPWLSPAVAYVIMRHLLSAIGRLHELGLVHRLLGPDSIFLTSGRIHILHAGLGDALAECAPHRADRRYVVHGSPRYMAPEQHLQPDPSDGRADLYAAGVLFYELLVGHHPAFVGQGLEPRREAFEFYPKYGRLPPIGQFVPAYAGSALEKFLLRATALQPESRFQNAQEFFEALGNIWRTFTTPEILAELDIESDTSTLVGEEYELVPLTDDELARLWASGEYKRIDPDDPEEG
jgi:hypothetical protein